MFVEHWMTPDPVTLPPTATIAAAAIEMGRHKFRHILVADPVADGKHFVGIVSKYDIARAFPHDLNPFSLAVGETSVPQSIATIMTTSVITVSPCCQIEDAARLLRAHHFSALPVVKKNRLLGIITESDVFEALLHMTGASAGGVKMIIECPRESNPTLLLSQLSSRHGLHIETFSLFPDKSGGKNHCIARFARRPGDNFTEELYRLGFRVLIIS